MNVNEIIDELRQHQLIGEMPDGYNVRRKDEEYGRLVERTEPYRYPHQEEDWPERPSESPNIGDLIWISKGDMEFPEIETDRIGREIAEEGIEAVAWYRSFHWYPPQSLGHIYS
jgi:hypothetical protein